MAHKLFLLLLSDIILWENLVRIAQYPLRISDDHLIILTFQKINRIKDS